MDDCVDDVDVDDRLDEDDRLDDDVDEEVRVEDDPADPRLDDEADRPPPAVERFDCDAVCQRFPPDPDDGRVMPAVGRPSSRFET